MLQLFPVLRVGLRPNAVIHDGDYQYNKHPQNAVQVFRLPQVQQIRVHAVLHSLQNAIRVQKLQQAAFLQSVIAVDDGRHHAHAPQTAVR